MLDQVSQMNGSAGVRVVKRARWLPHLVTLLVSIFAVAIGYEAVTSQFIDHSVIRAYLFDRQILIGTLQTLYLATVAMALSIVLGGLITLMKQSASAGIRAIADAYIWLFRGTPILVQIILFFNLGLIFPTVGIGLPFVGTIVGPIDTNVLMTPLVAAILGLGLNEAAYMSEIFRAGLLGVNKGEGEAARALGMHRLLVWRRITIPQVIRIALPPTGNEYVTMLKSTALVSVVAYGELMTTATRIYTSNARVIELLLVVCFWYLVLTSILSFGQRKLERYFGAAERLGARHGG